MDMLRRFHKSHAPWIPWLMLALYGICIGIMGAFHEPWFDETQAWLIARDADLRTLFLELPHYEGHPLLWHLLLMLPARAGLPAEPTLQIIQWLCAMAMTGLFLLRAPFGNFTKIFFCISYFTFFQYAVVARPYALMCFFMFLCAMFWREREEKPGRLVLTMLLICLTNVYGIALSFGLCLAWLWSSRQGTGFWSGIFKNKRRLFWLILLAVCALLITIEVMPAADTYALRESTGGTILLNFLLNLFVYASDCFFTNYIEEHIIHLNAGVIVSVVLFGVLTWAFLVYVGRRSKTLSVLLLPALVLLILFAVHFSNHHLGLLIAHFWVFLWISAEQAGEEAVTAQMLFSALEQKFPHPRVIRLFAGLLCLWSAGSNLLWDFSSASNDVRYDYCTVERAADYMRRNGLFDADYIVYQWLYQEDIDFFEQVSSEEWDNLSDDEILAAMGQAPGVTSTNFNGQVYAFAPEATLENTNLDTTYSQHKMEDAASARAHIDRWKEKGAPDVIVAGREDGFYHVCAQLGLTPADYALTFLEWGHQSYKTHHVLTQTRIYVRSDRAGRVSTYLNYFGHLGLTVQETPAQGA